MPNPASPGLPNDSLPVAPPLDEVEELCPTWPGLPAPERVPESCTRAHLVEIYGAKLGRRIALVGEEMVFGRAAKAAGRNTVVAR